MWKLYLAMRCIGKKAKEQDKNEWQLSGRYSVMRHL
jgi:hypothetical protein